MIRKFWTIVFLMLSLNTYADSTKVEIPWKQPIYRVNSDILNFNYNEMGYPSSNVSIGFKLELEKKNTPPRKRLPALQTDSNDADEILQGTLTGMLSLLFVALCPIPVIALLMGIYVLSEEYGKKRRKKIELERLKKAVEIDLGDIKTI